MSRPDLVDLVWLMWLLLAITVLARTAARLRNHLRRRRYVRQITQKRAQEAESACSGERATPERTPAQRPRRRG
jgi:heme exporter protein D